MRWLPLVVLGSCLLGCKFAPPPDVEFDGGAFDARSIDGVAVDASPTTADAVAIDAGTDAMEPAVVLATIPARIAVSDTVGISFTVQGEASSVVDWSITTGGGSFVPASGVAATNGSGLGTITADYSAPATAADHAHVLGLAGAASANEPFQTRVRTLTPQGESSSFADNGGQTNAPNYLYGQAVDVPSSVYVMRLALVSQAGGYNARIALYADNGSGAPGSLVIASALQGVSAGVVEYRVTPTLLAAGTYWLLINNDAAAPIKRHSSSNTTQAFVALSTSAPMPATLTGVMTAPGRIMNLYLQTAP